MIAQGFSYAWPRPMPAAILWGVAIAFAAVATVMFIIAGWMTLRGQYPEHAQYLEIPFTEVNAAAGEVEHAEVGIRLIPNERGIAVLIFNSVPRFPAFQFEKVALKLAKSASLHSSEVLWANRKNPAETNRLPLNQEGSNLSASLSESPAWTDRINGFGVAFISQSEINLESITLRPPEPTIGYLLKRMYREWTYREGYQGHTINSLKGAGRATLVPSGLLGGLALFIALGIWFVVTMRADRRSLRQSGLISAFITLWILFALPWIREVWAETTWSVQNYAGRTEAERRLIEPDADLYILAQEVNTLLPEEPQRIWLVEGDQSIEEYDRWKLKYYLAPHSAMMAPQGLPSPAKNSRILGDYVVISGLESSASAAGLGINSDGYRLDMLGISRGYGIFRIRSEQSNTRNEYPTN